MKSQNENQSVMCWKIRLQVTLSFDLFDASVTRNEQMRMRLRAAKHSFLNLIINIRGISNNLIYNSQRTIEFDSFLESEECFVIK